MSAMVVLEHVSKVHRRGRVDVRALNDVTFQVAAGEFVALMGPSGSGKSTLLHLVAGLEAPTAGTVCVDGECVSAMNDDEATEFRRRRIGFVYQSFRLLGDLTLEENVAVPLVLTRRPAAELRTRVRDALERFGLWERRAHLPAEVSGGELQRAAIARALVGDPALLLADEPTGNLDSHAGEQVLLDLRRTVDDLRRTLILVTHDPKAAAYADRVVRLRDGRVSGEAVE